MKRQAEADSDSSPPANAPWKFFRFRSVNEYLWQELELAEIYACEPKFLNDPFDCQVDPYKSIERAISENKHPERRDVLIEILASFREADPRKKSLGVSCFSLNMENALMWSHYAQSHSGVCLLYEIPSDYIAERYHHSVSDFFLVGCANVGYDDDEYHKWLVQGDMNQPIDGQPIVNAAAKTLVSKGSCWKYENEVRIIMNQAGFIKVESEFLTQVTFGLRTSERHKNLVAKASKRLNPKVSFVQTIASSSADFALMFEDITI